MPSVGLEFITQMGVHFPDYVEAGLEMHTNIYHDSSFKARVTMKRSQMRLSIPAPMSKTQLLAVRSVAPVSNDTKWLILQWLLVSCWSLSSFITLLSLKYSNKILSISSGQTKIVPYLVEDRTDSTDCKLLVSGLKFCTIVRYSNATSIDNTPYYPLTGETR